MEKRYLEKKQTGSFCHRLGLHGLFAKLSAVHSVERRGKSHSRRL